MIAFDLKLYVMKPFVFRKIVVGNSTDDADIEDERREQRIFHHRLSKA